MCLLLLVKSSDMNKAQQEAGTSFLLKTEIRLSPKDAHRTTGAAQKDPAEANAAQHPK